MAEAILAVEALTKRFGGFTAVANVSFSVEQGEILGLIDHGHVVPLARELARDVKPDLPHTGDEYFHESLILT